MSDNKTWDEQLEEAKKWLSEPFMEMFDENTFRIRRNLLAICSVVLVYKLASTGLSKESSFLGVQLEGLKPESIDLILSIGILYFLVHFVWSGWDKFREWKLRLTGLPTPKAKTALTFGSAGKETGTHDQRQATLSSWWAANTHYYSDESVFEEHKMDFNDASALNIQPSVNLIKQRVNELAKKGIHIEAYLERYEKGFYNLQRSERSRWFVLEFSLPIVMALVSLYLLII